VAPRSPPLTLRRLVVYRLRGLIAAWSHRLFFVARHLRWPGLYTRWARASLTVYRGVAWSQGRVGALVDKLESIYRRPQSAWARLLRRNQPRVRPG
jgi:hypothetical protein